MENGWQFSKVYVDHSTGGLPNEAYWKWAYSGWNDIKAHRYPMGKQIKPLYAWWAGERLGYIEARKKIYIPLYSKAVVKTEAFRMLQQLHKERDIALWDYDGYQIDQLFSKTMEEVINDPTRKMGHAFVLKMLLEE
jgi:hypothetical protein